ncbi:hypothetical protein Y1Q_0002747 [Alligator mississippiensis]|uniref:Uncharacterized protein n=1 Tax=Alligator mississippiensis TaxID=8496 RepID=A0A151P0D5_ALLMI|nr:hypothetical protein Y1Q_0002747 [Alligator mississippiensis]
MFIWKERCWTYPLIPFISDGTEKILANTTHSAITALPQGQENHGRNKLLKCLALWHTERPNHNGYKWSTNTCYP